MQEPHAEPITLKATTVARCHALGLCSALVICAMGPALGQTSPAKGPLQVAPPSSAHEDREIADYLALLQRIAPASEAGARTYLAAVRLRCGHALDASALRAAMAREGGEPVLMGLIRAAAAQDRSARDQSVAQIRCSREERK